MNITVVGLGYVGLPLLITAAKNGFNVTGFDIDEKKISKLNKGLSFIPDFKDVEIKNLIKSNNLRFTSTLERVDGASIFVIAVPTPLNLEREPNLSMLERACEYIAQVINEGDLVINESTSFIGTVRQLIKPLIESKSGLRNLDFAVAPERIDPGNKEWFIKNTPRLISGLSEGAKERAISFYRHFCDEIHEVSTPEVAEAAKLFENTFRQVNIALVNELAQIADKLNFSTHETIMAAATKPFGFMPFYPSIGVGGHCIPVDPTYLSYSAESVGIDARFIKLANQVNSSMPKIISERIKSNFNGSIIGKRIQVVGISYKSDISDLRESPALELINELKNLGAEVSWHDPFIDEYQGQHSVELSSEIDLGLIVTPHSHIDFSIWKKASLRVFDLSANSINYGWPKFI